MNITEKVSILEAILFAYGEPIEEKKISEATGFPAETIADLVKLLNDRYESQRSAIKAIRLDKSYQLCTKEEYSEYIKAVLENRKNTPISNAGMEVLTIIAYNQPVTKSFVENVRGIDSSSVINNLVDKCLVGEAGRLDVPGKPITYKTTSDFLRCFGISSLKELPPLPLERSTREENLFDMTKKAEKEL